MFSMNNSVSPLQYKIGLLIGIARSISASIWSAIEYFKSLRRVVKINDQWKMLLLISMCSLGYTLIPDNGVALK